MRTYFQLLTIPGRRLPNLSRITNYLKLLIFLFLATVVWSAAKPLSKENWWLEMLPVIIALPAVAYLGVRYKISHFSYTFIFFYLLMLVIQAHYGVGYVPIGLKLAPLFGTDRNVFDRLTHFFSGLLLFFPLYEITLQSIGKRNFLDYMIPAGIILGAGSVYEVAEWLAFVYSGPRLSFLFIGAQDDFYDTPKDMAMAIVGVILAVLYIVATKKYRGRKPEIRNNRDDNVSLVSQLRS